MTTAARAELQDMRELASAARPRAPERSGPGIAGLLALQSTAGNAAVANLLADRRAPRRDVVRIQRDAAEDLSEGDSAMERGAEYAAWVGHGLHPYRRVIEQLADPAGEFEETGKRMASGYRAWSSNYYNKTAAYLYEAEKASSYTTVSGRGPQRMAYLGVDTDEHSDVQYTELVYGSSGTPFESYKVVGQTTTAIEIKSSTSPRYASIDSLVAGGVKQLRKRELADPNRALVLEVHLDHDDAWWPITDDDRHRIENGTLAVDPAQHRENRLRERMATMKATRHVGRELVVRVASAGWFREVRV